MKVLKFFLSAIGVLIIIILLAIATMVTTMDKTPYKNMPYYADWKASIERVEPDSTQKPGDLRMGWAKVNITPDVPMSMAGYGNRRGKPFIAVHDSVFIRTMVIDNGSTRVALVTGDLLLIPPTVSEAVKEKLKGKTLGFEQIFFGATHTHNSVGGWGTGISGLFFSGKFDQAIVDRLSEAIIRSIELAQSDLSPSQIRYSEAIDTTDIRNRLVGEKGEVDPEIRSVIVTRADGRRAILSSYAAHSTILQSKNMVLSRDYPGVLVDSLENGHYDFAMYMAGAVGSMGPIEMGANDDEEMKNQAYGVQSAILAADTLTASYDLVPIKSLTLPLPMREPSPRLTMGLVLRPWAFKKAFGDFPIFVKALRIGNILMVGMPCDFSGELVAGLDAYAKTKGLNLIVTSFNGGYIGYITHDKYFNLDLYETKTMSWYGPYNGAYLQEVIKDIIDKLS
ncbi:neutral/alkaline non-lysosomal ceramidase N-terminal domain-containing protein [Dyadobacter tibetensis]|uniref:neutral/alkaline non-lysosomal ceramidase N-terminal domain-containing protein n=1 Tax=Dyadobacter tibetensis TaxID=1211851 RepID=UPI00046F3BB2|nr:neutral/alkaline non-lysosomal ceramidase N-terminal domain-containing protein [Dyadobacter tibetensis]